ncbi:MAG: NAD(P)-dependent alcohol dehydrogenase [Chloroflexota bacterium]
MRAMYADKYGAPEDVLRIKEVDKPVPNDDQVLVRVRSTSVNRGDYYQLRGKPLFIRPMTGLRRPQRGIPGADLAGEVESVGKNVTQFKPGDAVFGARSGATAEYVAARETAFVAKPANVTFEEAAAVPVAAITALQGLRDHGRLQPGQRVLINGASGGVGTFAIQIAKTLGADVTAVCNTPNLDQARSMGADRVIDYTADDFTKGRQRYDVVLDIRSDHSLSATRRVLTRTGMHVQVGGGRVLLLLLRAGWLKLTKSKRAVFFIAKLNQPDLVVLRDMLAGGSLRPAIDRCFPFSEAGAAYAYMGTGHARGKIVITI